MQNNGATNPESRPGMGIYMHQHRLPRKGRDVGICIIIYCEYGAFTVKSSMRTV